MPPDRDPLPEVKIAFREGVGMSVMRALEEVEYVYTREGKKRATHEAYGYMITPFAYPPIRVQVYKGHIDQRGTFHALEAPKDIIITQDEFKELLSPNANGKPAGDFRLSDILGCLKRRAGPKPADPSGTKASPAGNVPDAEPAKTGIGSVP
jgi:hypothetical protein